MFKNILIPVLFFLIFKINAQETFLIECNDSDLITKTGYGIDLINKLKDGKYIVYVDHECKLKDTFFVLRDTLITGFVKNGKRNGLWSYRASHFFVCDLPHRRSYLTREKLYEKGYLKSFKHHRGINSREVFFRPKTKKNDEDRATKVIFRDPEGNIIRIDKVRKGEYFTTEFYKNEKGKWVEKN